MQLPKRVTVELTNRCNRRCEGCPRQKMTYPLGYMSTQLFWSVLHQLPTSTVIVPFFRGESLLHPYFPLFMGELKGYHEVQLATNADHLTPVNQQAILDVCTFVSVSLHNYELPNKLCSFFYDALGANITTQVSILDSLLPSRKKRKRFIEEWKTHVNRVRIYKTHSVNGFGDMKDAPVVIGPCNKPFEEMVVYWDGKVGLCNHDWNNGTVLGDLNVQTVGEVWNDKPYQNVREFHLKGNRGEVTACKDCSFMPRQVYGELIKMDGIKYG